MNYLGLSHLVRFVGLRTLLRRPGRTLLTVLSVSAGIALSTSIGLINEATLRFFRESFDSALGRTSLSITGGESGFSEDLINLVETVPGVRSAVPVIETRAWTDAGENLTLLGVDLLREKAVRSYRSSSGRKIIGDAMSFISQPDSIILAESFAEKHGLKLDGKLRLTTAGGKVDFTIRGLLAPEGLAKAHGGHLVIMDIDAARIHFGKTASTDRIDVVVEENHEVAAVAERIRLLLGPGLTVERPELQSEHSERMLRSFQVMLRFFGTLALLVGVFLIANTVNISVTERRKEIGTLRAIGTPRRMVLWMIVGESGVIGALGALLGAPLGRLMATVMVDSVSRAMTLTQQSRIEVGSLRLGWVELASALGMGVCTGVLASFWPAWKASRIHPIAAMKKQDPRPPAEQLRTVRVSAAVGVVCLLFSAGVSAALPYLQDRAVEALSQAVAILGAALLGPAMVSAFLAWLQPWADRGSIIARLAVGNLSRNIGRTSGNVVTLMVGLVMVILISAVNLSFRSSIGTWFKRILHADLLVSTNGRVAAHESQQLDEEVREPLSRVQGVAGVYSVRVSRVSLQAPGETGGRNVGIKAFDEMPKTDKGYAVFDVQDRPVRESVDELFSAAAGGVTPVMVSTSFAMHFGKKTGDVIEMPAGGELRRFRIIAVMVDYFSPNGVIYLSRKAYRELFKDRLVSALAIETTPGEEAERVRERIHAAFPREKRLTVVSNVEMRAQVDRTIDESFGYTKAIEGAALLVALFGLMNTLLVSVLERTRELGMMRAIGTSRGQLMRMLLIEAGAQGVLGACAASVFGAVLSFVWISRNLAHVLGWILQFHFPWSGVGLTLTLGVAVAVGAGWYPARRAGSLEIAEALDYE